MRRGSYAPGAIECGMLVMAMAQMARFYNVPNGGYIGLTNPRSTTRSPATKSGMSNVGALLAGADMFNMAACSDALMCFEFCESDHRRRSRADAQADGARL